MRQQQQFQTYAQWFAQAKSSMSYALDHTLPDTMQESAAHAATAYFALAEQSRKRGHIAIDRNGMTETEHARKQIEVQLSARLAKKARLQAEIDALEAQLNNLEVA